ncbi:MAG: hypothetical protein COA96_00300 [SAR86 cluster bacterium]|uniref:JmjC domain-containing protein n=1 Tax=SAR86 cluster bacterium TaxID=2030880 RepID=A0A2A5BAW2_9GAMM|nr:MAG: hypothetical protein COA96_00300 [SAR86 cluster bacterium]
MESEMMNMFATPLYKSSINRSLSEQEVRYIRSQLSDPVFAVSNHSSRNKNVLDAQEMESIRGVIQENINSYFKTVYNTSNDVVLQITQSWLTVTRRGESHHSHIHPNSIASGVLYINVAEDDGINFSRNEDQQWYELMRDTENYYSASRYYVNTKVGDLLIFPSNVLHGVKEVATDIERISLAFNTFFSGELGRDEFSNSIKITLG